MNLHPTTIDDMAIMVESGKDKEQMDIIRNVLIDIVSEEEQLIVERVREQSSNSLLIQNL